MAFNIVKHRRGTTQEWLELNLIPEEGELVIEECQDGTCRCKIGNGKLPFAKLHYVEEATQRQLLTTIADLEETLNNKVTNTENVLTSQISSTEQTLTKALSKTVADLETDYSNKDALIVESLQNELNKTTNNLRAEFKAETDAVKVLGEEQLHTLNAKIEKAVSDTADKASMETQEAIENLANSTQEALSTAVDTLTSTIAEEVTDREKQVKEITQSLESLEDSIENNIQPSLKVLDNKLAEAKKTYNDSIEGLEDTIQKISDSLTTEITTKCANTITELEKATTGLTKDLTTAYTNKIAEAKSDLQKSIIEQSTTTYNTAVNTLRSEITGEVNTLKTAWATDLKTLKDELILADGELFKAVDELNRKGQEFSENTLNQLSILHNKVGKLIDIDDDVKNIWLELDKINTGLADNVSQLNTKIAEQRQLHLADYTKLFAEIDRVEESQRIATLALNDLLVEQITNIYIEIADLIDDDITILNRVYAFYIELTGRLSTTETTLTADINTTRNSLEAAIKASEEALNKNLADKESALKTLISGIKSTLSAEINNLKTAHSVLISNNTKNIRELSEDVEELANDLEDELFALKRKATTLDNKLSKSEFNFNNQITTIKNRLDAADSRILQQSNRISSIITSNSNAVPDNDELADIRIGYDGTTYTLAGNAVRALGEEIRALKDGLSSYMNTQAVNGLRYDYEGEVGLMAPYMLYLTANGEVIPETGVQIISGFGGGGGGTSSNSSLAINYITTSPVVVTATDKVILQFTFSGTDSSGDKILQASAAWRVGGKIVEYGTVKDGSNEFDATKYLSLGKNTILLTVSDDNGSVATKTWTIQQIELSVDSSFNDKLTYTAGEKVIFDYTPFGAIDKTAIFKLDGDVIARIALGAESSGRATNFEIPPQEHGSKLLEFYLEAQNNGKTIYSEHKTKDILYYDSSAELPVIGTQIHNITIKQYSTTSIVYTVYDPKSDTPTVSIEIDGEIVSNTVIKPNQNYGNTPTSVYSYTGLTVGEHIIKIICGKTEKIITVQVEDLGINIAPVTTGLAFDFNPSGLSNGDTANRLWSYGDTKMSVSDNFDWTNGGYIPNDPDGPCFCIKAGSTATIDYKLFAEDAKRFGKEFKFVFKTKNVANPDAVFLSCLDNTTEDDYIGIEMGAHTAKIFGQTENLETAYSEEDIIEFEFNISKETDDVPMVMCYEDGVPSRPMVYNKSYSFKQNTPKEITLGSPDCDLYIYRIKAYNISLSAADILNNFIADARTADELIARYTRNQIYDENNMLNPDVLAEKCPWLRIIKISAPRFTSSKKDDIADTTIQQIYGQGRKSDNWVAYDAVHSGQGTSSDNYGAAGRNIDLKVRIIEDKEGNPINTNPHFVLSDNSVVTEVSLTENSIPVDYFNIKVNIASSNNLTNAILAKRYNEFNPYKRPYVREDSSIIPSIKDTMEFHNCVVFIQETDPNLATHREFADNDWHFYAIGNIGDSKKTDKTRVTDPEDKYECCVEIMDVGRPLADFPADTMMEAMAYSEVDVDASTKVKVYTWAKPENLGILYEKIEGEYVLTSDTEVDLTKTYYVDILEHDDFSEDYTYGWRYHAKKKDAEAVAYSKQAWIDFYRFVTTASDEDFKAKLSDYFVVNSALYYYLFTTRYCMVDNRAKNTFWHYGKTADGTRKWDLCWDYDNDTSLGLNNYGKQVYRYGLEDIDTDEAGEEVFRESDSVFFCRIRDLFANELQVLYNNLEDSVSADGQSVWSADSLIKECDAWQTEFPEELWRLDIERKYLRTYTSSFISGPGQSQFLVNMCNGRMKYHRRQWERDQEQYMASKYQTLKASADSCHANFRFGTPNIENPAVPANYALTLTPYSYMYLTVAYSNGTSTVRAVPNIPVEVPYNSNFSTDIVNVYSASLIRDFGDLSKSYPRTVVIGNASRVKKLTLGNSTEGYDNKALTKLDISSNYLLEELNIENISSLGGSQELTALTNLKKLKAFGTNITSVLFAPGGKLSYVELPAVNDITLNNLRYLSNANLKVSSYDKVVRLVVDDCPLINQADLFNCCNKLTSVRLSDVHFNNVDYDYFVSKVFNLKGLTATGGETENAVLIGSANFEYLFGSQFNELSARYPQLTLNYDTLESTITFMNTDLQSVLHQDIVLNAADYRNPVVYDESGSIPDGMIAKPVKTPTVAIDYDFIGWSTTPNVIIPLKLPDDAGKTLEELKTEYRENSVKRVEGDRVLYPVFKEVIRKYKATFVNPTAPIDQRIICELWVDYGTDAKYPKGLPDPTKLDTSRPTNYSFIGWFPDTATMTKDTTFEAQFEFVGEHYIIPLMEISGGYTLNEAAKTLSITKHSYDVEPALEIPETFNISGVDYTVVSIYGFSDHLTLELIVFPDTVKQITSYAFARCNNLTDLVLPKNIQSIGERAFDSCIKIRKLHIPKSLVSISEGAFANCGNLEEITVDSENPTFIVKDNCLINKNQKILLIGMSNGKIPDDGTITIKKLGKYCFSNTALERIVIPDGVGIDENAFSNCKKLSSVSLPNDLKILRGTCFAWCRSLTDIKLPDTLEMIQSFVFYQVPLDRVDIPAKVTDIYNGAFSEISTLREVHFNAHPNGTIPNIHPGAFKSSGSDNNPIHFYLPWTEEEHLANFTGDYRDMLGTIIKHDPYFGAKNAVLHCKSSNL